MIEIREWPRIFVDKGQTFAEGGVHPEDRGLIVTVSDGSEYQVTIAESRGAGAGACGPSGAPPHSLHKTPPMFRLARLSVDTSVTKYGDGKEGN